jgi:hypothetical protein
LHRYQCNVIGDRAQIGTYAGAVRIDDDVAASGEPVSAKMPPASKFGGTKPIVPTNGDPSLIVTV